MTGELIRLTDLKNWAYCPRVVYYHRVMPGAGTETYKMSAGLGAQALVEGLELRRTLERYGLQGAERRYGVWLASEKVGLSGRADLVLVGGKACSVVDYKLTGGDPGENHRMQLHGYALMLEAEWRVTVEQAFLYRIPDDRVFRIAIDDQGREAVWGAVAGIREMVAEQLCPEGTEVRGRCRDCEFANFCGDVW